MVALGYCAVTAWLLDCLERTCVRKGMGNALSCRRRDGRAVLAQYQPEANTGHWRYSSTVLNGALLTLGMQTPRGFELQCMISQCHKLPTNRIGIPLLQLSLTLLWPFLRPSITTLPCRDGP